jgi:hypothetical protein
LANIAGSQIPQSVDLENDLPQHRATVTCGATLEGPKTFKLKADLDCSAATAPITVRDKGVLDLNGHTLFGVVLLRGQRAQLNNGNIDCQGTDCVVLRGEGKHVLENVTVRDVVGSEGRRIVVTSDNNSLIGNTVHQTDLGAGFAIEGNNNILQGNIVMPTGDIGYDVRGNENLISDNASVASPGTFAVHFVISGDGNTLAHNVVSNPEDGGSDGAFLVRPTASNNVISRNVIFNNGIEVGGQNNVIEQNIVRGGFLDDLNTNCDNNTWRNNTFDRASQPCIR